MTAVAAPAQLIDLTQVEQTQALGTLREPRQGA